MNRKKKRGKDKKKKLSSSLSKELITRWKNFSHYNRIKSAYFNTKVCLVMSDFSRPHELMPSRLLCSWDFPGKNAGVSCHFLLQRIFPTRDRTCISGISCIGSRFFRTVLPEKHNTKKCIVHFHSCILLATSLPLQILLKTEKSASEALPGRGSASPRKHLQETQNQWDFFFHWITQANFECDLKLTI